MLHEREGGEKKRLKCSSRRERSVRSVFRVKNGTVARGFTDDETTDALCSLSSCG